MNHPNLSPHLNAVLSGMVEYKALEIGDILDIDAADASNVRLEARLRLQVVAFEQVREGLTTCSPRSSGSSKIRARFSSLTAKRPPR